MQQDEIAQAMIEQIEREYQLPTTKFSAAVTDGDSPGGMRLVEHERPFVFVQDKPPPHVLAEKDI